MHEPEIIRVYKNLTIESEVKPTESLKYMSVLLQTSPLISTYFLNKFISTVTSLTINYSISVSTYSF